MYFTVFLTFCALIWVNDGAPIDGCSVLDLTHTLGPDNTVYGGYVPFMYNKSMEFYGKWNKVPFMAAKYFCMFEHTGTHIDAPFHFSENAATSDTLSFDHLIGEACMIDISAKVAKNRDYGLSIKDVEDWEKVHGRLSSNCILLLHTGQGKDFFDAKKYLGTEDSKDKSGASFHFSSFSKEVAAFVTEQRKVRAIGVDSLSLDVAQMNQEYPAHIIFLDRARIPGMENMANLDKLPPRGATVFIPPIKLLKGTGGPVRAFALGWKGKNDPCSRENMLMGAAPLLKPSYILILAFLTTNFLLKN